MSLLKTIDPNSTEAPRESRPLPERLISGDPSFKTWTQDVARDGLVHTGIWEATPGLTRSIKGETFEFCHILQGVVELTPRRRGVRHLQGGRQFRHEAGLHRHMAHDRNR